MLRIFHDFAALFQPRRAARRVDLPGGGVIGFKSPARVKVERGTLWLTLPGLLDDVTLTCGQSTRTGRGAVFEALEPATITIST